jgi:ribosomal protein S18 acetylase RimI-like enzyme
VEGLTIRSATSADTPRIVNLIARPAGQEAIAIAGCEEAALKMAVTVASLADGPQSWQHSTVAELNGKVVGLIQNGTGEEAFRVTPGLVLDVLRIFGVGIVSVYGRYRARLRVNPDIPMGTYYISELHVDPDYRNRGIAGALLDHAEREARERELPKMSLMTTTINPARRLYERKGYRVVETKTDRLYERYTGIAGRHLMVKELS